MGGGARESAQYDRLRCAHQVLCQRDSSADYYMESERSTSAGSVPQLSLFESFLSRVCHDDRTYKNANW